MSDFYTRMKAELVNVRMELFTLDQVMSRRFERSSTSFIDLSLRNLIDRIYFNGEPPPRYPVHSPFLDLATARAMVRSVLSLPQSEGRVRRRDRELEKIGKLLNLTPRHVRRRLNKLRRAGMIPSSWLVGSQWHPPVTEAVHLIRESLQGRAHRIHTRERQDAYVEYLVKCRDRREQLQKRWAELQEIEGICDLWSAIFHRHSLVKRQGTYDFMETMANNKGWTFCKLVVVFLKVLSDESRNPFADVERLFGLSHATFFRRYGTLSRQAHDLAHQALPPPNMRDRVAVVTHQSAAQPDSSLDVSAAFEDWTTKVPDKDLWLSSDDLGEASGGRRG